MRNIKYFAGVVATLGMLTAVIKVDQWLDNEGKVVYLEARPRSVQMGTMNEGTNVQEFLRDGHGPEVNGLSINNVESTEFGVRGIEVGWK